MTGVISRSGVLNGHVVPLSSLSASVASAGIMTGSIQTTSFSSDHSALTNRELPNQHPMSAITNLEHELDEKLEPNDALTNTEIENILRRFV